MTRVVRRAESKRVRTRLHDCGVAVAKPAHAPLRRPQVANREADAAQSPNESPDRGRHVARDLRQRQHIALQVVVDDLAQSAGEQERVARIVASVFERVDEPSVELGEVEEKIDLDKLVHARVRRCSRTASGR